MLALQAFKNRQSLLIFLPTINQLTTPCYLLSFPFQVVSPSSRLGDLKLLQQQYLSSPRDSSTLPFRPTSTSSPTYPSSLTEDIYNGLDHTASIISTITDFITSYYQIPSEDLADFESDEIVAGNLVSRPASFQRCFRDAARLPTALC